MTLKLGIQQWGRVLSNFFKWPLADLNLFYVKVKFLYRKKCLTMDFSDSTGAYNIKVDICKQLNRLLHIPKFKVIFWPLGWLPQIEYYWLLPLLNCWVKLPDHLNMRKLLELINHLLTKVYSFHENENQEYIQVVSFEYSRTYCSYD